VPGSRSTGITLLGLPDYVSLDPNLLACFKVTVSGRCSQEEVASRIVRSRILHRHLVGGLVELLTTSIIITKAVCYAIEGVPGDKESFYAFVAYPLGSLRGGRSQRCSPPLVRQRVRPSRPCDLV